MRIVRTIVVAVLALAIAMLPASMSVATAAPATNALAVAEQTMPDCSHHQQHQLAPAKQTQKTIDHSGCISGCALCFGFVGADVWSVAYVITPSATLAPVRARDHISSLMGSPPFRPPRA